MLTSPRPRTAKDVRRARLALLAALLACVLVLGARAWQARFLRRVATGAHAVTYVVFDASPEAIEDVHHPNSVHRRIERDDRLVLVTGAVRWVLLALAALAVAHWASRDRRALLELLKDRRRALLTMAWCGWTLLVVFLLLAGPRARTPPTPEDLLEAGRVPEEWSAAFSRVLSADSIAATWVLLTLVVVTRTSAALDRRRRTARERRLADWRSEHYSDEGTEPS